MKWRFIENLNNVVSEIYSSLYSVWKSVHPFYLKRILSNILWGSSTTDRNTLLLHRVTVPVTWTRPGVWLTLLHPKKTLLRTSQPYNKRHTREGRRCVDPSRPCLWRGCRIQTPTPTTPRFGDDGTLSVHRTHSLLDNINIWSLQTLIKQWCRIGLNMTDYGNDPSTSVIDLQYPSGSQVCFGNSKTIVHRQRTN